MRDNEDYSGKKFARLMIFKKTEIKDRQGDYLWEVKCECEEIKLLRKDRFLSG